MIKVTYIEPAGVMVVYVSPNDIAKETRIDGDVFASYDADGKLVSIIINGLNPEEAAAIEKFRLENS